MKKIIFKSNVLCIFCYLFLSFLNFVSSQWITEDTLYNGDGLFKFISVADSSVVWAAGSSWTSGENLIYKRNLAGEWSIVPLNGIPSNQQFTCLAALNSQIAFVGIGYGNAALYRTTNSGLNWYIQISTGGSNGYLNDIRFSRINPAYGYAWSDPPMGNGTAFKIYKTSNYGNNWILFDVVINPNYVGASPSICVTDSVHAWFGLNKNIGSTDYGKILFTSNGGINFSLLSLPLLGNFVTSVEFNENNLLGYSTILNQSNYFCKSTNGGASWFAFNPSFILSNCRRIISIANTNVWYALNTYGVSNNRILKSTNNGLNWFTMQLPAGQYDIQFMDAILFNNKVFVYAISTGGYALKLVDTATLIGIHNNNSQVPNSYLLKQNYPNPFNPQTVIDFNVPNKTFVNITLYDILGRIIDLLVNESKNAGNYSIQFRADRLSSGIYFYKMTAGNYTETKKMIIQK